MTHPQLFSIVLFLKKRKKKERKTISHAPMRAGATLEDAKNRNKKKTAPCYSCQLLFTIKLVNAAIHLFPISIFAINVSVRAEI